LNFYETYWLIEIYWDFLIEGGFLENAGETPLRQNVSKIIIVQGSFLGSFFTDKKK